VYTIYTPHSFAAFGFIRRLRYFRLRAYFTKSAVSCRQLLSVATATFSIHCFLHQLLHFRIFKLLSSFSLLNLALDFATALLFWS